MKVRLFSLYSVLRNSTIAHKPPHLFISIASIRKMSTQPTPTFSSNYDPEQGAKDLAPLLKNNGGKWVLIESGKGIERGFKFKGFKKCWVRHIISDTLSGFGRGADANEK